MVPVSRANRTYSTDILRGTVGGFFVCAIGWFFFLPPLFTLDTFEFQWVNLWLHPSSALVYQAFNFPTRSQTPLQPIYLSRQSPLQTSYLCQQPDLHPKWKTFPFTPYETVWGVALKCEKEDQTYSLPFLCKVSLCLCVTAMDIMAECCHEADESFRVLNRNSVSNYEGISPHPWEGKLTSGERACLISDFVAKRKTVLQPVHAPGSLTVIHTSATINRLRPWNIVYMKVDIYIST